MSKNCRHIFIPNARDRDGVTWPYSFKYICKKCHTDTGYEYIGSLLGNLARRYILGKPTVVIYFVEGFIVPEEWYERYVEIHHSKLARLLHE